jgi:3-oxo-5-alpha-steroid 4-dehydrogenase 1
MDPKLAWFLQELPSWAWAVSQWWLADPHTFGGVNRVLLGLYILHYSNRTFVFPLRMRGGKPTPFFVFLLAFGFCLTNGFLQARFLTAYAAFPEHWESSWQFLGGIALFFGGMYINLDSDSILRNLRKSPEDKAYYIPHVSLAGLINAA